MTFRRIYRTALIGIAAVALAIPLLTVTLAQVAGPAEVTFGGFDYAGGVTTDGTTQLTFAGTEFAASLETAGGTGVSPVSAGAAAEILSACLGDNDGDGLTEARELQAGLDPCLGDTDGDGLPDGGDVEFVQSAVANLPKSSFKDNGKGGHQNSIRAILDSIEAQLIAGDTADALSKIANLRKKVDGCSDASGKADKDDWIVACAAQIAVRQDLDLLASNVSP